MMKKNKTRLPQVPYWLLKKIYILDLEEGYSGDIEEEFQNILIHKGRRKAVIWIWIHAVAALPKSMKLHFLGWGEMLKNYFKSAFRYMGRHKSYSFINITGLAVGIACCLLILSWIRYELSYDRFHTNSREIYRIISEFHSSGGKINYTATSQAPLAAELKNTNLL